MGCAWLFSFKGGDRPPLSHLRFGRLVALASQADAADPVVVRLAYEVRKEVQGPRRRPGWAGRAPGYRTSSDSVGNYRCRKQHKLGRLCGKAPKSNTACSWSTSRTTPSSCSTATAGSRPGT